MNKIIARPTFNRKTGKWNIACKVEGEKKEIKLGNPIDESKIFYKDVEFNNKAEAVDYIKNSKKLMLKSKMTKYLAKYSR